MAQGLPELSQGGRALLGGFDDFEEGVLGELLLDAVVQIQRRQLQDLHRLDHLGRLNQSLLQTSGLMES